MDRFGIKPEERVCYNCKHILWLVALGVGVRCGHTIQKDKAPPIIPNLRHTCDKFENKNEKPS